MQASLDVTVITPTIPGREALLKECIASVENQITKPVDHLIDVDKDRDGPATIRNRLARKVTTEWVTFLDDDDLLMPNHFSIHSLYVGKDAETLASCVGDEKGMEDFTVGNFDYLHDVVGTLPVIVGVDGKHEVFHSTPDYGSLLNGQNTLPITCTIRTEIFLKAGGFREHRILEDMILWKSIYRANGKFRIVHIPTWYYRLQPESRNSEV